jgi:DNA-3-methyladenine glycosylase
MTSVDELSEILLAPPEVAAPRLLGCLLVREYGGHRLAGRIVETEAYAEHDAASHSYRGRTPRTEIMFGAPGHLYVYFTYGMHYCANVVTGPEGFGSAVLIRAIEPLEGLDEMSLNRHGLHGEQLTNGPAKFCQAFAIDKDLNGHDLRQLPLQLLLGPAVPKDAIVQTTRIGISQATDVPWRFYIRGNNYVSRPL